MSALRTLITIVSAGAAVAGCEAARQSVSAPTRPSVSLEAGEAWRSTALPQHVSIAEDLPGQFRQAAASRRAPAGDRALLDPDLKLPRASPAPGAYRCRMVRLGSPHPPSRGRRAGRESYCFVGAEEDRLALTLETPERRLGGYLWDGSSSDRLVFLGAEIGAGARSAPPYGDSGAVSTAGLFDRIGDFRYRLAVRGPVPGSIDVYELIAAPSVR